jgi:inner membrane protein
MDPLTHSLFGLVLGQTGLKRWTRSAAWVAVVASSAPDLDSIFEPFNDVRHLVWHRHFTHSLLFVPLVAAVSVGIVKYVLRRPVDVKGAMGLAMACTAGHLLCDTMTYRGMKLLLPLTNTEWGLQSQGLVDPVMLALLGLALGIPFLSNLVSGEIGAKQGSGRATALLFLVLVGGWWYTRYTIRGTALEELRGRVYEGMAPVRVDLMPTANPVRFEGMVETEAAFKRLEVDLREYVDPEAAQTYFKPVFTVESGRAAQVAGADAKVQQFLTWAHWPRWQVTRYEGATRWVVVVEELASARDKARPRVVVRLNEAYEVLESRYEAAGR